MVTVVGMIIQVEEIKVRQLRKVFDRALAFDSRKKFESQRVQLDTLILESTDRYIVKSRQIFY